jgi:hypothetical protein
VRYFIFEGNVIVPPATMNEPLSRRYRVNTEFLCRFGLVYPRP